MKQILKLSCIFLFFSFSGYSQIDAGKTEIDKKYKGSLTSQKQDGYLAETKTKETDTITFFYDNQNIAKMVSIKNQAGITNREFHSYVSEINPKFRFHSKAENETANVYFNEDKTFANILVYADRTKSKIIEIIFLSGQRLIQSILPDSGNSLKSAGSKNYLPKILYRVN